jgi:hypothetical protein
MADRRILFFGDSLVAGVGDPSGDGWVGRVVAASCAAGLPVTAYNLGVGERRLCRSPHAGGKRRVHACRLERIPASSSRSAPTTPPWRAASDTLSTTAPVALFSRSWTEQRRSASRCSSSAPRRSTDQAPVSRRDALRAVPRDRAADRPPRPPPGPGAGRAAIWRSDCRGRPGRRAHRRAPLSDDHARHAAPARPSGHDATGLPCARRGPPGAPGEGHAAPKGTVVILGNSWCETVTYHEVEQVRGEGRRHGSAVVQRLQESGDRAGYPALLLPPYRGCSRHIDVRGYWRYVCPSSGSPYTAPCRLVPCRRRRWAQK